MTEAKRNDLIRHAHILFTVGILVATVWGLQVVAGLPFLIAMLPAGVILHVVSKVVVQRVLPPLPRWSDEERLQAPKLRLTSLVLGSAVAAFLYLGMHVSLLIALAAIVPYIGTMIAIEQYERGRVERRLRVEQKSATSC